MSWCCRSACWNYGINYKELELCLVDIRLCVCVCVCVCVCICALYLTWAVTFIPCASGPSTLVAGGWGRRWRWCDRDAALCPYSKHSGTNVILTQKNCMLLGKILCVCVCYLVCEVGKLVKVWIFSSRSPSGWYHLKKKANLTKPNSTQNWHFSSDQ